MSRDELKDAYLTTSYAIDAEGQEVVIRINERNAALDRFLIAQNAVSGTCITGWNPRSEVTSDQDNAAANQGLLADLTKLGLRVVAHEGRGANAAWTPEKGFFVLGGTRDQMLALAERWGQFAIVYTMPSRPPELVFTRLFEVS